MKKVDNLTVHTGPYILIKKVLVEFTAGFGCLDRIRSYPKESATDPTKITGSATLFLFLVSKQQEDKSLICSTLNLYSIKYLSFQ